MDEKVEEIVQKIVAEEDVEKEEIQEKIEEKKEELSGFITPEGAATIVARSYGITPEREEPEVRKLLIEDLSEGMSNVDIVGRVSRTFEPREFEQKDGSKGKVANIVLMDKTGEIRTVLWGKRANLISEGEIRKGDALRLKGAYIKKGMNDSPELNLGRRGEIEIDPVDERSEDLPPLSETKVKISDLDPNSEFADVVGRIIAVTEPREFERSDKSMGKVATLRIIDETGQCRVSLWGDKADQVENLEQGDAILLENATVREGWQDTPDLHLNWRGRIVKNISSEDAEKLPEFERKLLKIEEVEPDMPILDLAARVKRKFPPNEFERKDGSKGKVMNVTLSDETGSIRASFWDDQVEIGQNLSEGDVVLLENAKSAAGLQDRPEIRIGGRTKVKTNPKEIEIGEMKSKRMKISGVGKGLDSLEVVGRVIDTSEARSFTRDDESEGKVGSMKLGDGTGTIRVTLWGEMTKLLEEVEKGDIIRVSEAYSVSGNYGWPEIHVGKQGEIEVNPAADEELPPLEEIKEKPSEKSSVNIDEVEEGTQPKIRGTVAKVFERIPVFNVCPKCGRNLENGEGETLCEKCGEVVEPEPRAVVNLVVDDGTENIRVVAFGEIGEKLIGKPADEISEALKEISEISDFYEKLDLEGREIIFSGTVRRDNYFDQLELLARNIDFPDPIEETKKILEKIKE